MNPLAELKALMERATKTSDAYDQACRNHPGGHPARIEAALSMDNAQRELQRAMGARADQFLALADAAKALHDALDKWSVNCPGYVADAVCDTHSALSPLLTRTDRKATT